MFNRRLEKGQCFYPPVFGCREFPAEFGPVNGEKPIEETRDLGLMLYDIAFDPKQENNQAVFFNAKMEDGVINTNAQEVLEDKEMREEVLKCSYKR